MGTDQIFPYATHLDIKFTSLCKVDVPALVRECKDRWYNQTLCKVNDSVVRLGVMQGEYHWHKHDADDEFFFVLREASSSIWRTAVSSCNPEKASSFPGELSTALAPRSVPSF